MVGPITKFLDHGYAVRLAAIECLMHFSLSQSHISLIISSLKSCLIDSNIEVRLASFEFLLKFIDIMSSDSLVDLIPLIIISVKSKPKEDAVEQELQTHKELVDSANRCLNQIRKYSKFDSVMLVADNVN